jgi:TonB-linked SusC/RagA family outer membrane protein
MKREIIKRIYLSIIFLLTVFSGFAQQNRKITGNVTDQSNQRPLPGVSIGIKDSRVGAITDADGKYSISVPSDKPTTLVFKYVGYEAKEVVVDKQTIVNVVLVDESRSLDQVVVIGYGSQKKGDLSSAIGEVNMKQFQKAPVASFDQALAGRVAGVSAVSPDGQPGGTANIVIRGVSSITQDNSPLYVIDGFPSESSNAASINPAEIESITILKDASATAIYGSRGSNGVVIITTKRGTKGAPVISYDAYAGFQKETKRLEVLSPYEFVREQIDVNPNTAPIYLTNHTLDYYKNVQPIKWQDAVFRPAFYQNHNLALRGGDKTTQYSVSGSILDQNGVFINSNFARYQGRFTVDHQIGDKFRAGVTANFSNSVSSGIIASASSGFTPGTALLYNIWTQRPFDVPGTDLENQLVDPSIDPTNDYRMNPIIDLKNTVRRGITNNNSYNGYLQYNFTKHLNLKISGGVNQNNIQNEAFYSSKTRNGNPVSPFSLGVNGSEAFNKATNWSNDNILTYNNNFKGGHNLNIIAGFTIQRNDNSASGYTSTFLPNENEGLSGLDEGTVTSPLAAISYWSLLSYLSRINYSFKDKYYLQASIRSDRSSKFPINKTGYFPTVSGAWRFTKESIFKDVKWLSNGKFRVGYGVTGNNRVSDFAGLNQLTFPINPAYSFNNSTPTQAAIPSAFGNPNLKWESTATINAGMDLDLFNSRLNLVVDLYRKTTTNLLLNAPLPPTTGYSSAFKNIGKVQNQGLEITVNSSNIATKSFSWNTGFNITFNANKIIRLTDNSASILSIAYAGPGGNANAYIGKVGQPIGQMYGYVWDGNYQYSDFYKVANGTNTYSYLLKQGIPYYGNSITPQPGSIKYKDLNGDGIVNADDQTVIGRATPIFQGGFSNDFAYKGFDLSIFIQYSYGGNILNATRLALEGNNSVGVNQLATEVNRWSPTNQTNQLPAFNTGSLNNVFSSRVIEDGSFIRFKTLSLGYRFTSSLLDKIKIKNLRVYASAQNLFVITPYSGPDPEVSTRNSALTPAFDYSAYPVAKTIVFGINTSF